MVASLISHRLRDGNGEQKALSPLDRGFVGLVGAAVGSTGARSVTLQPGNPIHKDVPARGGKTPARRRRQLNKSTAGHRGWGWRPCADAATGADMSGDQPGRVAAVLGAKLKIAKVEIIDAVQRSVTRTRAVV